MFKKILIANRAEIACRIIRTCRELGISTVAVFSDSDVDSPAVKLADESVYLGASAASDSYLSQNKIIQAALSTGADAVHPGYGFLSENASFASSLRKSGVTFIGPDPEAIAAMGDKIESKKIAQKAKVNTVPGYLGIVDTAENAIKISRDIGFPVMIKASAGGGGKGMRIAHSESEVSDCFRLAMNEAKTSFDDDRIFIEKYIEEPRHIEIQILADNFGNIVHLGERECSIQRRHQKGIEEAPSVALDPETREAMGKQACDLARAVKYRSAGTVEFIVDQYGKFYFLEMNTRLQVEHPVTEMVTGLDLVELMISIASGEKLSFSQDDVTITGWAIESRIYAEDPKRNFLPSIGRLTHYKPPDEEQGSVRLDSGVIEGSEISIFYDPMISKLITYGEGRREAIDLMKSALDNYYIKGTANNVSFLSAIISHPRFLGGQLSTNFISDEFPDGFVSIKPIGEVKNRIIAAAVLIHMRIKNRERNTLNRFDTHLLPESEEYVVSINNEPTEVKVSLGQDSKILIGTDIEIEITSNWEIGDVQLVANISGQHYTFQIYRKNPDYIITHSGIESEIRVFSKRAAALLSVMPEKVTLDESKSLISPMPGLLVSISVESGAKVRSGEELAVVEAMKMENILYSNSDGTVKRVLAAPGDSLAVDQVILEFE